MEYAIKKNTLMVNENNERPCAVLGEADGGQSWPAGMVSKSRFLFHRLVTGHKTGLEISKNIGTHPAEISLVSLVLKTNCFLASMLIFPFHSHVTGHKTGLEISKNIGIPPCRD